ncbi:MAG: hypothetical protein AUJ02_08740 [Chloroflexi bacterium 13_1_40CM_3_65_12]|nr:MAG: hypothetical protein AUJ02_08740 [Chloroflexi bacterium 13_1_40CM_3_65_12]
MADTFHDRPTSFAIYPTTWLSVWLSATMWTLRQRSGFTSLRRMSFGVRRGRRGDHWRADQD